MALWQRWQALRRALRPPTLLDLQAGLHGEVEAAAQQAAAVARELGAPASSMEVFDRRACAHRGRAFDRRPDCPKNLSLWSSNGAACRRWGALCGPRAAPSALPGPPSARTASAPRACGGATTRCWASLRTGCWTACRTVPRSSRLPWSLAGRVRPSRAPPMVPAAPRAAAQPVPSSFHGPLPGPVDQGRAPSPPSPAATDLHCPLTGLCSCVAAGPSLP